MFLLKELRVKTARELMMARLARKIGRGHDAIYHGTRHLPLVMRMGKLIPSSIGDTAVFFSRSPEVASYWANFIGFARDGFSGGILVLDRGSLARTYRLELSRYTEDWNDEREEAIWDRVINFRRHLLGVVRELDIDKILGPPKHRYCPDDFSTWSEETKKEFWRRTLIPPDNITRAGRRAVRNLIVRERERPTTFAAAPARSKQNG